MRQLLTIEAAQVLGVPAYTLENLMVRGRIARPAKDAGGRRLWTAADIARARKALAERQPRRAKEKPQV